MTVVDGWLAEMTLEQVVERWLWVQGEGRK